MGRRISANSVIKIFLFLGSLGYLLAEVYFNMSLLEVAGTVHSKPETIESIQFFGRAVSAMGCVFLVLGFFAKDLFYFKTKLSMGVLSGLAVICIMPFLVMMIFPRFHENASDVILALLPALGFYFIYVGKGANRYQTVVALMLMVWPAVFLGQKMLVEQLLVDQTSWTDRLSARYVLMLRQGFEDCAMTLDDLKLCDEAERQDIVKSARIIMGALWTLYPEGIKEDMIKHREYLIRRWVLNDKFFSTEGKYKEYIDEIAKRRDSFQKEIMDKYYKPYKEASDKFTKESNSDKIERQAEETADKIEKSIDEGWKRYLRAQHTYNQMTADAIAKATHKITRARMAVEAFCMNRYCPFLEKGKDTSDLLKEAKREAEEKFAYASGGYAPDIRSKHVFESYGITQYKVRDAIEKEIQKSFGIESFKLPDNWSYDRQSFIWLVKELADQTSSEKWRENFGNKIKPGMSLEDFFVAVGMAPLPEVKDIAMTKEDFFLDVILPAAKQKAVGALDKIKAEAHFYADGKKLEDIGKSYVRAIYVPAIALVISLMVVALTLARGLAACVNILGEKIQLENKIGNIGSKLVKMMVTMACLVGVWALPYTSPNPYADGTAYQRYYKGAYEAYPIMASVLDWTLHAQPFIYRWGTRLSGDGDIVVEFVETSSEQMIKDQK